MGDINLLRGARSEAMVIADLFSKGFFAFKDLSGSCPVDIIAYSKESHALLRIQVKTRLGQSIPQSQADHCDILACTDGDRVVYRTLPDMEKVFLVS